MSDDSPQAQRLINAAERARGGDSLEVPDTSGGPALTFMTEVGMAERFASEHGRDVRYVADWGGRGWTVYADGCWQTDNTGEVMRLAKRTIRGLFDAQIVGVDVLKLHDFATKCLDDSALNAILRQSRCVWPIPGTPDQFDQFPYLFNCGNGTLDLRTGELREFDRDDLLMKRSVVMFDAAAEAPTWVTFLRRIMADDEDMISFLARAVGYSLTADVSEDAMFILHGGGANGKSTFLETIHSLLGDYALVTPAETLLANDRNGGGIPNDVARMRGARFVSASETDEGTKLSIAKIKRLTGGDTISARFMRGEFFDFPATFKLWLGTNHQPNIRESTVAIWRRLKLIPFTVSIPEREQDKSLKAMLRVELPGILNWALAGLKDWQTNGLGVPAKVRDATARLQAEQDELGEFIEEHCDVSKAEATISKSDLHAAFANSKGPKEWVMDKKTFGRRMRDRGFDESKSGSKRLWKGIRLRSGVGGNAPTEDKIRAESGKAAEGNPLFE